MPDADDVRARGIGAELEVGDKDGSIHATRAVGSRVAGHTTNRRYGDVRQDEGKRTKSP